MSLNEYDDLEKKMKGIKRAKALAQGIDHCQRGIDNKGLFYHLGAEDEAESERSIVLGPREGPEKMLFSVETSAAIYKATAEALSVELEALRAELGL